MHVAILSPGLLLAVALASQEAPDAKRPEVDRVLTVQIVCKQRGVGVPRNPKAPVGHLSFQFLNREVAWVVGKKACATIADARRELDRIYADKTSWHPDPEHPGAKVPLSIQLAAGEHVAWFDVATTADVVRAARFYECRLPGQWSGCYLVPKCPGKPVFAGGEIILPPALYQEPDEMAANEWRPEVDVLQDGRILCDDEVLVDPEAEKSEHPRLLARLEKIRAEAGKRGKIERREIDGAPVEIVHAAILIRADKWVEWRHVQALLQACGTGPLRFQRIDMLVAERDEEAGFVDRAQGK